MIISAKTIIPGDGKTVLRDSAVRIDEGRIQEVGLLSALKAASPNEEHIDYGDATILPGMIDMHIHLAYWCGRADEKLYTEHMFAYLALATARNALYGGVTTVRDAYSPNAVCRQLDLAAKKGFVRAPRIFHCNRALIISGGIDWQAGGGGTIQVDGPENIRRVVREQFREGATWIKTMADWHMDGVSEYDQDELNMIAGECHRLGHKAMGHASHQPTLQMCIDAGFDTIEHGTGLTVEQARQMKQRNMAWVPTMYVYKALLGRLEKLVGPDGRGFAALSDRDKQTYVKYSAAMKRYRDNFLDLYNTGVTVLSGTDCPFDGLEYATVAWEMACMVEFGLEPVKAIQTATQNAAKVLEMEGEIGTLQKGAVADVVVADGDASRDITALQRIQDVYQAGEKITRCL